MDIKILPDRMMLKVFWVLRAKCRPYQSAVKEEYKISTTKESACGK